MSVSPVTQPAEREASTGPGRSVAGSVVIPAHNEAAVIAGCLAALFDGSAEVDFDVVVSCNGCTDGTADLVRSLSYPVQVLEVDQPSKIAALRAAELACATLPRLYLDADVVLPARSAAMLLEELRGGGVLAVRPSARYETSRSPELVRRFYRARDRVPGLHHSLWGAGIYGVSAEGRTRFDEFPDVVADDLFLDRLFTAAEKKVVACDPVTVTAAGRTADLFRMLRRSYRGKAQADERRGDPQSSPAGNLRHVLAYARTGPTQCLDALVYICLACAARFAYRVLPERRWERDESSRTGGHGRG